MFSFKILHRLTLLILIVSEISCEDARVAMAHLDSGQIAGNVYFTETDSGLHVSGAVVGLGPGKYGFHIHELGDISTCDTTGAHFNPDGTDHGGRDHETRHVGDLGNVEFVEQNGIVTAELNFSDDIITLRGRNSILGRALVLHEQEDDLGLGNHETSLTTGNAGARIACGVIGLKSPSDPWNSAISNIPSIILLTVGALFAYL